VVSRLSYGKRPSVIPAPAAGHGWARTALYTSPTRSSGIGRSDGAGSAAARRLAISPSRASIRACALPGIDVERNWRAAGSADLRLVGEHAEHLGRQAQRRKLIMLFHAERAEAFSIDHLLDGLHGGELVFG
jgi:hypothetical protein